MFDLKILEIAIGLIFIYLLLSLLATAVNEFVMRFLYSRGENLKRAITRMLEDSNKDEKLIGDFYKHPLIEKFTNPSKWNYLLKINKPSYLTSNSFSKVLLEVLGDKNEMNVDVDTIKEKIDELFPKEDSSTRKLLLNFVEDANGNLEQLKSNLENWYELMMERTTGWYKRRVQLALLIIGFSISVIFNADTIQMAKNLSSDPAARASMIEMAENYYSSMSEAEGTDSTDTQATLPASFGSMPDSLLNSEIKQLIQQDIPNASSIMGMGWSFPKENKVWYFISSIPTHLFGWLITTFAIALGAPFWFDMLGKVTNIRNAGKNPDDKTSKTEQPSD